MDAEEIKIRNLAIEYLDRSGERKRLIELMDQKLNNSGWKNQVEKYCEDLIKEKGIDNITINQLIDKVSPKAKEIVPDDIKNEMLNLIQKTLEKHFNVK